MTAASCIYCGTQADQTEAKELSDEHIIPYALGGNLVLPKASCDRCAKETHAFEGHLAGKTYEFARTHLLVGERCVAVAIDSDLNVVSRSYGHSGDSPLGPDRVEGIRS
jgi:hypothetical protein